MSDQPKTEFLDIFISKLIVTPVFNKNKCQMMIVVIFVPKNLIANRLIARHCRNMHLPVIGLLVAYFLSSKQVFLLVLFPFS